MLSKGSNVLEKPRYKKLLIQQRPHNMATAALSAKISVRQGTKIPVLNKTRRLSSKELSPVSPITLGTLPCTKCENVNKENMIECRLCVRWFHYTCESLEFFQLEFLAKNQHKIPYSCIECCSLMDSCFGKVLRECHENLKERVSQTEKSISLIDSRLKAVEQLNKYEENLEFQEAVDKKLEKYITNIKSDIKEMEKKIERFSEVTKTEFHGNYDRRKRLVIFGMPNENDDVVAVQGLIEFLEIGEMNIKKIFRINSRTNNDRWAPRPPPLNIEFYSMSDKFKFFNNSTREKLRNVCSGHLYINVKIAPDRSFQERQRYRLLRDEMDQRNSELAYNGIADEMWIIRKMSLEKVQVEYDDE